MPLIYMVMEKSNWKFIYLDLIVSYFHVENMKNLQIGFYNFL